MNVLPAPPSGAVSTKGHICGGVEWTPLPQSSAAMLRRPRSAVEKWHPERFTRRIPAKSERACQLLRSAFAILG
jgi:hypothetical protein